MYISYKVKLLEYLTKVIKHDKVFSFAIDLLKSSDVHLYYKEKISKFLFKMINKDTMQIYLSLLMEKDIEDEAKQILASYVWQLDIEDEAILNKIHNMLLDNTLSYWLRINIAESLVKMDMSLDINVHFILKYIQSNKLKIDIKIALSKSINKILLKNKSFLERVVPLLHDEDIAYMIMQEPHNIDLLAKLSVDNKQILNFLFNYLVNSKERGLEIASNLASYVDIDNTYEVFVVVIKNQTLDAYTRINTIEALVKFKRINKKHVSLFFKLLDECKQDAWATGWIAKTLATVKQLNDKQISELLFISTDKSFSESFGRQIVDNLIRYHKNNKILQEEFLNILSIKNMDYFIRNSIVKYLSTFSNDKLIDILIFNIYDENTSLNKYDIANILANIYHKTRRENILNSLLYYMSDEIGFLHRTSLVKQLSIDNIFASEEIISLSIAYINDGNVGYKDKKEVLSSFGKNGIQDNRAIMLLIEYIKNKYIKEDDIKDSFIPSLCKLIEDNVNILNLINIGEYHTNKFLYNLSIEVLFKGYNKGYVSLKILVRKAYMNNLILSLKNNKLCTVYENQKIFTQEEVDLEDIMEVKKELKVF